MEGNSFTIEEATIEEIHRAFAEKKLTTRQLVDYYLQKIQTLNPILRGVIEVNPDVGQLADEADQEREAEMQKNDGGLGTLGKLHGIPVLLKDTIGTKDKLNTTAGSYALLGSKVPRDAGVVEKLRKAGVIILGKASMSEWYKFRSLSGVPNGWCARVGQGVVRRTNLKYSIFFCPLHLFPPFYSLPFLWKFILTIILKTLKPLSLTQIDNLKGIIILRGRCFIIVMP